MGPILRTDREWLNVVARLRDCDLPCNVSTVAFAVDVARRAVAQLDDLVDSLRWTDTPTDAEEAFTAALDAARRYSAVSGVDLATTADLLTANLTKETITHG